MVILKIPTLTSDAVAETVRAAVQRLKGMATVQADPRHNLTVTYDDRADGSSLTAI